jgi:hypothetical protein
VHEFCLTVLAQAILAQATSAQVFIAVAVRTSLDSHPELMMQILRATNVQCMPSSGTGPRTLTPAPGSDFPECTALLRTSSNDFIIKMTHAEPFKLPLVGIAPENADFTVTNALLTLG